MPKRDIVVVGASAGGIDALQTVLGSLPWNLPASVFIVLHTSQNSPGLLPEILNRSSMLPAIYAVHHAPILPSRAYIAPSGQRHMVIEHGRVRLLPGPRENRHRPSIDALFRSAALAYGSQVIGVVLTGNLDDGSAGLAQIKSRGGLAIVQDPEDATSPSMPESAIDSTEVDFILPASQIGPKLAELVSSEAPSHLPSIPAGERNLAASGQTYSCPECGGVLEETHESGLLRFRCRVGHLYSPDSLMADQTVAVERALWAAVRSMEEQSEFAHRLAESSRQKHRARLARRFAEKADASREYADTLRELLQRAGEKVEQIPQESANPEQESA